MYYVYVNHLQNRALVHDESCSEVAKTKASAKDPRGYWIGPIESKDLALVLSRATGKLRADYCKKCKAKPV